MFQKLYNRNIFLYHTGVVSAKEKKYKNGFGRLEMTLIFAVL